MISNPYQPLVPGLDGPMEGMLASVVPSAGAGLNSKVRVAAGVIGLAGKLIEQSAAEAVDATKDVEANTLAGANLAAGTHLLYINHPDAKETTGAAMPRFTIGRKEEYVPKTNIINNTKGELTGRSKVLAEVTVDAAGDVTAVRNAARYELKHFQGTFTAQLPGGLQVDNVNLDKA